MKGEEVMNIMRFLWNGMMLMFTARANSMVLILICILYVSENGCRWIINHSKNQVTWDQFCYLEIPDEEVPHIIGMFDAFVDLIYGTIANW